MCCAGYNRFGKPIYECTSVIRLDPRALGDTPGPHTVVVYPGQTSAENSVAYGTGLAARGGAGACTAGDTSAFYIRSFDKFGNPRLSGGDSWKVSFSEDVRSTGKGAHEGDSTGACLSVQIANLGNGTYEVNYQATCSGRYWVYVTLDGSPLGRAAPPPSTVTAPGAGSLEGSPGANATRPSNATDEQGRLLRASVGDLRRDDDGGYTEGSGLEPSSRSSPFNIFVTSGDYDKVQKLN